MSSVDGVKYLLVTWLPCAGGDGIRFRMSGYEYTWLGGVQWSTPFHSYRTDRYALQIPTWYHDCYLCLMYATYSVLHIAGNQPIKLVDFDSICCPCFSWVNQLPQPNTPSAYIYIILLWYWEAFYNEPWIEWNCIWHGHQGLGWLTDLGKKRSKYVNTFVVEGVIQPTVRRRRT